MMALLSFLHFLLLKSNIVSKYYFSWVEVPIPNINVLFTHSYFNWLFIQAEVCKYTSMSWSYWAFSPLYMFALPLHTVAEFTCWSPSTCMHSCSIAYLLSRPEEGWENPNLLVTCYIIGFFLIYNKGQSNLIYIVSVVWCPSPILHILSWIKLSSPWPNSPPYVMVKFLDCLSPIISCLFSSCLFFSWMKYHVFFSISETSFDFL